MRGGAADISADASTFNSAHAGASATFRSERLEFCHWSDGTMAGLRQEFANRGWENPEFGEIMSPFSRFTKICNIS